MRISEIFDGKNFYFVSSWWFILLFLNAFVGIVMLELTWKRV